MLDQTNIASAETALETIPDTVVLLRVWWAIAWRQCLWLVVVFLTLNVMSLIIGVTVSFMDVDADTLDSFGHVFGFSMALLGNVWAFIMAFRQVLGKQFAGHKLLFLMSKDRD
jgi:hypothetical protein